MTTARIAVAPDVWGALRAAARRVPRARLVLVVRRYEVPHVGLALLWWTR